MKENSREEDIKILEEKMNKELDFLIENANKTEQLTAISIIAMKEPIILLFLSILSDYKRVLEINEVLLKENEHKTEKIENQKAELAILNEKQKDFNKLQNTLNSYRGQFRRQEKEIEQLRTEVNSLKGKLDEIDKINFPIIN